MFGRWRTAPHVYALGAFLLPLALYAVSVTYPFAWDDTQLIQHNPALNRLDNISRAVSGNYLETIQDTNLFTPYYRPVSLSLLFVEYALFQANPVGYRVVCLLLHSTASLLLFILILATLRHRCPRNALSTSPLPPHHGSALGGSLLLSILPYTADAVLFISNTGDLMVMNFFLLALIVLHRFTRPVGALLVGLLLLLACGAKETGVAASLLLILVCGINPLGLPAAVRRNGAIAALLAPIIFMAIRSRVIDATMDPLRIALRLPMDFFTALRWGLLPHPLTLEISVSPITPGDTVPLIASAVGGAALLAAVLMGVFRYRHTHPLATLLAGAWALLILPSLAGIYLVQVFSPRYLYLPGLALAVGAGWLYCRGTPIVRFALIAASIALLLLTSIRIAAWRSRQHLWELEVDHHPQSTAALSNLAAAYRDSNQLGAALETCTRAIRAAQSEPRPAYAASTYHLCGKIVERVTGNTALALDYYRKSAQTRPNSRVWMSLGDILAYHGDWDGAHQAFTKAIALAPHNPHARILHANALAALGHTKQALSQLDRAADHAGNDAQLQKTIQERRAFFLEKARAPSKPSVP